MGQVGWGEVVVCNLAMLWEKRGKDEFRMGTGKWRVTIKAKKCVC